MDNKLIKEFMETEVKNTGTGDFIDIWIVETITPQRLLFFTNEKVARELANEDEDIVYHAPLWLN